MEDKRYNIKQIEIYTVLEYKKLIIITKGNV
jgi:hypothetical protein